MENQQLYTTGEIAKLAGVTIRTIRYYDSRGVLKPSTYTLSGHRLYTEKDLLELRRVLALKHLGLSLGEATTTDHNNYSKDEMVNALQIQKTIIQNKIHSMKTLLDTIVVTEKSIEETSELDWSKIIEVIQLLESEKELRQKYRDLSNLNAEIKLINRFSLEENGWYRWVYEQLDLQDQSKVLEIGCGNGALWSKNIDQIPYHLNVTLTEECEDMLKNSQQNIGNNFPRFKFKKINLNQLQFPEESFDVIVANYILFYVKNIDEVLAEIFRVLKTNGHFYCSTMGCHHLQELEELVKAFDSKIVFSKGKLLQNFDFEKGELALLDHFNQVSHKTHTEKLLIYESEGFLEYVYSVPGNILDIVEKKKIDFESYVKQAINQESNKILSTSSVNVLFKAIKE